MKGSPVAEPSASVPGTHYLLPGALFVEKTPHVVTTILGSCVAVALWDPATRVAGLNHYLMPMWNGEGIAAPKYGNIAMEMLLSRMERLGAHRSLLLAKVFGGSSLHGAGTVLDIGARNVRAAMDFLDDAGIRVAASDVGGRTGRRVVFFTETGLVRVKELVGIEEAGRD